MLTNNTSPEIIFYTYILKSEKDNGYYFGHTSNITVRTGTHNSGKVRSTKGRRPLSLHYYETFPDKSSAYKRELFFKSFPGRIWLIENKIIEAVK